jgi:rhodanese-related sulfurtransferase
MAGYNAKSVNLGWDLGISKVDGVKDVTETKANALPKGTPAKTNSEVATAIAKYFKGLDAVKGTTYANYKISEANAKALLDKKDKDGIFLSVRNAADFAKGHIDGAVNIPFGKGMEKHFSTLPKDKKIIVYCYTGQTAGQTVTGLRMLGYDAVSLNGGTGMPSNAPAGWANQGYPLVK